MNTPVVKAALEMGFSRSLVRQMVQQQILVTGENYRTVSDIVSALVSAEGERREEKNRQTEETASGIVVLVAACNISYMLHGSTLSSHP